MRFLSIAAALTLTALTGAIAAEILATPRVALLYSDFGDFRHRDDYDAKMAALGWKMDKYENKEFAQLVDKLGGVDILLGSALFNYSNVQDFSEHNNALLQFVGRGGALVLTDTNYPQHVDWLAKCAPGLQVKSEACGKIGTPFKWLDDTHPLFNIPHPIRKLGDTWSHMVPGEDWEVIARCDDNQATALFRRIGRGYVLLTNHWGYSPEMLENLYGCLQCCRVGLFPVLPDLSKLSLGDNRLAVSFKNVTEREVDAGVAVEVARPDGKTETFRATAAVGAGQTATSEVTVPLVLRGEHRITVHLTRRGRDFYTAPAKTLTIPDLVTLRLDRPSYRGSVYLSAPPTEVVCQVMLNPHRERLEDLRIAATLTQGDATLAQVPDRQVTERQFTLTIPARFEAPGEAVLRVSLLGQGQAAPLAVAGKTIPVYAAQSPQVFIDDNLATVVDGQPFFPIGVYHVGESDLPKARSLGFNCYQGWGTSVEQAKASLDAGQANGLKVLLEMSSLLRGQYQPEAFRALVEAVKDHPALLTWYTVDEPDGPQQLDWCRQAYRTAAELDPHHPVYLVMCNPGTFDVFGTTTDVLAVDPYPIPNSVVMVSNWMKRAQEAVEGIKPIWVIPQLHNWEAYKDKTKGRGPTPEEERNMVYQGLIWGAKGVIYYPWDDGPTGLIHDEKLMAAVGAINSELAIIGPAVLSCTRQMVAENEGDDAGLYAAVFRSETDTYVIAANVLDEEREYEVRAPGIAAGNAEVMFEGRSATVADGVIRESFGPLEVHVYHAR